MNERIQQLAEQAISKVPMPITFNHEHSMFAEKFAELIVKECIQSIQSGMDRETMHGTISLAKHVGMVSAKAVIKQHFGVEE